MRERINLLLWFHQFFCQSIQFLFQFIRIDIRFPHAFDEYAQVSVKSAPGYPRITFISAVA